WAALNLILREHRLEPPRLRLVESGKSVPADSFVGYSNGRRSSNRVPHLRAPELTQLLRNGATLILDAVQELYQPLTALAEDLERTFQVPVQINAYAGWRTSQGFDCHWDDHDVFILQVAGRKHWRVYGTTREYPLARDIERALERPDNPPVWDGFLENGDMLYIPRGWWHEAIPVDEPTLHLTLGIHNVTGADLLSWFVERLRTHPEIRQDLPRFATAAEQARWVKRIGEILAEDWRPNVLAEYVAYLNAMTDPRPAIGLPWTAMPGVLPADDGEYALTWNVIRPVELERGPDGTVELCANRKRYRFAAAALPVLQALRDARTCSLEQLWSAAAGKLDRETIRVFVRELVSEGLVSIASREPKY
ncbi:MAG: hypothetical protein JOZ62_09290, partial [Acidobacteriaceae bacterium]|nr:hypothetical protein [Acidobacteriaceae bacterium]